MEANMSGWTCVLNLGFQFWFLYVHRLFWHRALCASYRPVQWVEQGVFISERKWQAAGDLCLP